MTITNYTFFSPNGDDFPITANADAKLYMMLTGANYDGIRIRHWTSPLNTALNRVYTNTSVIVAGRYFEIRDHSFALLPNTTNYIHAVIDISDTLNPVSLTVENSNTSNTTDINNNSGVIKRLIEKVVTDTSSVVSSSIAEQKTSLDALNITGKLTSSTDIPWTTLPLKSGFSGTVQYKIQSNIAYIAVAGLGIPAIPANTWTAVATLPDILIPSTNRITAGYGNGLWALLANTAGSTAGAPRSFVVRASTSFSASTNLINGMLIYPLG